jgi:putative transcriptional regulator
MENKKNHLLVLLRTSRNITANKLARELNLKTTNAYYKKENGQLRFSLQDARKLSKIFKMSIEDLFFSESENESEEDSRKIS